MPRKTEHREGIGCRRRSVGSWPGDRFRRLGRSNGL